MVDASSTFERMVGYTVEELRNTVHWEQLTPSEYRAATARAAEELATRGKTAPYEKEFLRKDGSRFWGLFAPTVLAGRGTESECVEFIIDITESKRNEQALRDADRGFGGGLCGGSPRGRSAYARGSASRCRLPI
jgi:PAS domain S-box-containing protein